VTEVRHNQRKGTAALALAIWLIASAVLAADAPRDGAQPVPPLRARVTDLTGTLTPSESQALEGKLAAWESRTGNQLAVLIVPTTQPETLEEYGIRVTDAWKLGQKGKDNGVLFLIAKNDKRMRIEVGYGLEGELTDVASRRIIGDTVAPLFSQGQFAAGINAGADRIMRIASGDEPAPKAEPQRRQAHPGGNIDWGTIAIMLLIGVPAIGAVLRSIFGNVGGSLAGAGLAGGAVWLFLGSLAFGAIAAVIAFVLISFTGFAGRGGPGMWIPGAGGGFGGGGFGGGGFGGGGFSGGGGGFGGGGASGGW